jgi:hypothetical protein
MVHREKLHIIKVDDFLDLINLIGFSGRFTSRLPVFDYHPNLHLFRPDDILNEIQTVLIGINARYDTRKTAFDYHPNLHVINSQEFIDKLNFRG